MTTTIVHILSFGPTWTLKLACGCSRRGITRDEMAREQFFIGKRIECDRHPAPKAGLPMASSVRARS